MCAQQAILCDTLWYSVSNPYIYIQIKHMDSSVQKCCRYSTRWRLLLAYIKLQIQLWFHSRRRRRWWMWCASYSHEMVFPSVLNGTVFEQIDLIALQRKIDNRIWRIVHVETFFYIKYKALLTKVYKTYGNRSLEGSSIFRIVLHLLYRMSSASHKTKSNYFKSSFTFLQQNEIVWMIEKVFSRIEVAALLKGEMKNLTEFLFLNWPYAIDNKCEAKLIYLKNHFMSLILWLNLKWSYFI